MDGRPIGVPVAARPWHDATALTVARVIEEARVGWPAPAV